MKVRTAFEIVKGIVYICMQICMLGPCAVLVCSRTLGSCGEVQYV